MGYRAYNPYKRTFPPGSNWRRIALRLWLVQVMRDFLRDRSRALYQAGRRFAQGNGPWIVMLMAVSAVLAALVCKAI